MSTAKRSEIEIVPVRRPVEGAIRPPGSKSITNRALVCAALAEGNSVLSDALTSDDTAVMIEGLRRLGIAVEQTPSGKALVVSGCGGRIPAAAADLHVGNSGTTMRFLTAMVALGHGRYRLDGVPRMRERPIQDLLEALSALGVAAGSESDNGCPPVVIEAAGLPAGKIAVSGEISSQFLSGLLMAAPYAEGRLTIEVRGPLVSQPYVAMTLRVMQQFGVALQTQELRSFTTPGRQRYEARDYAVEPDASAASYFLAAAAITGGRVAVEGLDRNSLQGDVAFCDCLTRMGCRVETGPKRLTVIGGALSGIEVDMNAISDTVQTLGAVALFARGPTTISGVAHIRHKETDRIAALAAELRKLGATVEERADGLTIHPGDRRGAAIDTYDDHRMAMSMALVGLRVPGVIIRDPDCTAKTYPAYFEDLDRLVASARS